MKLLVTGGAGFIGSNFIHHWLQNHPEDSVINLDKLTYAGNLENLSGIAGQTNYKFVKGDICDRDLVFDLVRSVDAVVHFAAETHVDRSLTGAAEFVRTNVLGTQTLLDAAKEYNKRFHHISTDEVFGALGPNDRAFDENTPYAPTNPYSASKAAADHLVRAYFLTHKVEATITNASNNYGPFHFPEKFIPLFICNLAEGKSVPVYGDGLQIRDWLHVNDHARGVEQALMRGKAGETYCLGGNNEISNLEVTRSLINLLGRDESFIEHITDRPGHDRRYAIDSTKAQRELDWQPEKNFKDGLKETVRWFLNNKDWVDSCRSGSYQEYYENHYHGRSASKSSPTTFLKTEEKTFADNSTQTTTFNSQRSDSPKPKILILGAGYIGQRCAKSWPNTVLTKKKVHSRRDVLDLIKEHQPDAILNAAGIKGQPNVDWCEDNQVATIRGNTILPLLIADACQETDVYLLHIGSGCIFYGDSPHPDKAWREDDFGNPTPVYSRSKWAADLTLTTLPNVGIGRIRMPIDWQPSAGNLINKLATFSKVIDVENSVTIVDDMVDVFYQLLAKKAEGVFHVTNPGTMRHRELLGYYKELVDPNHSCEWISNDDLVKQGLAKKGRSNNFLHSSRLAKYDIHMRPIKEALRDTMEKYAQAKSEAPINQDFSPREGIGGNTVCGI